MGLGLNPRIMAVGGPPDTRVLAAQTLHNVLL
jgi:hypothetical protein